MSDAPRWPGTDGGPGLDFSPYRRDEPQKEAEAVGPAADETQVHSPVWPDTAEAADSEPSDGALAEDSLFGEARSGEAHKHGGDSPVEATRSAAPVPPRVAERAARTAQEWAAMPVGPGASGPGMAAPVAGVAAGAAGAGALGARAARPVHAVAEDADPLPLDEVAESKPAAAAPAGTVRRPRRTRKARLRLARVDPWSVMKTTLLFAIAFGIMVVVATFALWSVLAGAGTLDYVNTLLNQLFGDQDTEFDVTAILSLNRIMGFSAIVAAINVVILTALATLFSFLYNLAATVMGGLEVTLAED